MLVLQLDSAVKIKLKLIEFDAFLLAQITGETRGTRAGEEVVKVFANPRNTTTTVLALVSVTQTIRNVGQ